MLHGGAALDEVDEPHRACTLPVVGEVRGRFAAGTWHDRTVTGLVTTATVLSYNRRSSELAIPAVVILPDHGKRLTTQRIQ